MFNYPFKPNSESFVGKPNRQIVEEEEASEQAEPASEEDAEHDESHGPVVDVPAPNMGPRQY